jgi:hypothetical protein
MIRRNAGVPEVITLDRFWFGGKWLQGVLLGAGVVHRRDRSPRTRRSRGTLCFPLVKVRYGRGAMILPGNRGVSATGAVKG